MSYFFFFYIYTILCCAGAEERGEGDQCRSLAFSGTKSGNRHTNVCTFVKFQPGRFSTLRSLVPDSTVPEVCRHFVTSCFVLLRLPVQLRVKIRKHV